MTSTGPVRSITAGIERLRHFRKLHGDIFVNHKFVIPHGDTNWPVKDQGYKLGSFVRYIRRQGPIKLQQTKPKEFQELTKLGFCWDAKSYREAALVLAFTKYKEIYGTLDMNRKFVVPKDDPRWPKETHGLKLGVKANYIRNYDLYNNIVQPLEVLGFDFGYLKRPPDFEIIFASLLVFKEKYGHCAVPFEFYVASDDVDYPELIRGCNLGRSAATLRMNGYYKEHHDRLLAIGFPFCSVIESKFNMLFEGFQIYKRLHGTIKIPLNFVVPNMSPDYPKYLWNVRLGGRLEAIRRFRAFRAYAYRMEELGVVIPQAIELKAAMDAAALKMEEIEKESKDELDEEEEDSSDEEEEADEEEDDETEDEDSEEEDVDDDERNFVQDEPKG